MYWIWSPYQEHSESSVPAFRLISRSLEPPVSPDADRPSSCRDVVWPDGSQTLYWYVAFPKWLCWAPGHPLPLCRDPSATSLWPGTAGRRPVSHHKIPGRPLEAFWMNFDVFLTSLMRSCICASPPVRVLRRFPACSVTVCTLIGMQEPQGLSGLSEAVPFWSWGMLLLFHKHSAMDSNEPQSCTALNRHSDLSKTFDTGHETIYVLGMNN